MLCALTRVVSSQQLLTNYSARRPQTACDITSVLAHSMRWPFGAPTNRVLFSNISRTSSYPVRGHHTSLFLLTMSQLPNLPEWVRLLPRDPTQSLTPPQNKPDNNLNSMPAEIHSQIFQQALPPRIEITVVVGRKAPKTRSQVWLPPKIAGLMKLSRNISPIMSAIVMRRVHIVACKPMSGLNAQLPLMAPSSGFLDRLAEKRKHQWARLIWRRWEGCNDVEYAIPHVHMEHSCISAPTDGVKAYLPKMDTPNPYGWNGHRAW